MGLSGRFTPTPVGTTPAMKSRDAALYGSPPRLWGRRQSVPGDISEASRFTPTPVGTTKTWPGRVEWPTSVHPHACGDDASFCWAVATASSGSPPRLWGRRDARAQSLRVGRFTPTPVGTTRRARIGDVVWDGSPPRLWGRRHEPGSSRPRLAVHPHACGDDGQSGKYREIITNGSPPRLWGRRGGGPAASNRRPVHPHACGDDSNP